MRKRLLIKEKNVLNSCIQYLTLKGYVVIRNNTGAFVSQNQNGKKRFIRFGQAGSSDIIACSKDGKFVAVECKSDTGRVTPYQSDFLRRVKSNNGIAVIVRTIDDLIKAGL